MRNETQSLIEAELSRPLRACVTTSFQIDGVVLLDLVRRIEPSIPVLFVDTVHHFPETYAYRDAIAERWRLRVTTLCAQAPEPGLWRQDTEACCHRHKVEPLLTALEHYDVWFTALRREQSPSRAGLEEIESIRLPGGRTLRKVNPLARWTTDDVWSYARTHDIPALPLYDDGYTSIGCEPCTTPPPDASNPRSGRWRGEKLECGIHLWGRQ